MNDLSMRAFSYRDVQKIVELVNLEGAPPLAQAIAEMDERGDVLEPPTYPGAVAAFDDEAVHRAANALLADSGLPRYGGHRATIERRVRIALDAATLRGVLLESDEVEQLRTEIEELYDAVQRLSNTLEKIGRERDRLSSQLSSQKGSKP